MDENSKPFFSVVMGTYNRGALIASTIARILEQSFTNFEFIIVNDGSTDNTQSIIQSISDPRMVVINQENKGCTLARKAGCDAARGEWLAFCDSDDMWASDYLQTLFDVIKNASPSAVFSNYCVEGEETPRLDKTRVRKWLNKWTLKSDNMDNFTAVTMKPDFFKGLVELQPIMASIFAVNREHFEAFGGIIALDQTGSEDAYIIKMAAVNAKVVFIDKVNAVFGRQGDNMSSDYIHNLIGGLEIHKMLKQKDLPADYLASLSNAIKQDFEEIFDQSVWHKNKKGVEYVLQNYGFWNLPIKRKLRFAKFKLGSA